MELVKNRRDEIKTETAGSKPSTSQRVSGGNRDLIESIGNLLVAKTGLILTKIKLDIATNAKDLKMDNASLKCELKSDNESLKSELKSDLSELMSENESLKTELKLDIARNVEELKSDMKTAINISHEKVMNRVEACELRVEGVEKSVIAIPGMVQTVALKMSQSSDKLKEVDAKVTRNSANIEVLKNWVKTLNKRKMNNQRPILARSCQLVTTDRPLPNLWQGKLVSILLFHLVNHLP